MNTTEIKIEETKRAIVDGASEVDMVINIGELKSRNQKFLVNEISQIATLCHANNVLLKVIIETALLNQEEKILACKVVSQSKADFIKTSTGFSTSGAKLEDIKLLKKNIDTSVRVKASGGIKDLKTAMEMLEAGASRLGTSSGVAICENKKSNQEY